MVQWVCNGRVCLNWSDIQIELFFLEEFQLLVVAVEVPAAVLDAVVHFNELNQ